MNEKMNITTILFDLDGVIIDSNEVIVRSWRSAAADYNYIINDDEAEQFIIGASPEYTLDNLFSNENNKTREAIHNIVSKLEEESYYSLIPGIDVFLKNICGFNLNIGIVTSSWPEKIHNVLRGNDLHMFSHIVSRLDVCKGKPSPEPYCTAINHFNSNPKETLVFEDSVHGITSAIQAGAKCIAIGNNDNLNYEISKVTDFRSLKITNDEPDYFFPNTDFGIKILTAGDE